MNMNGKILRSVSCLLLVAGVACAQVPVPPTDGKAPANSSQPGPKNRGEIMRRTGGMIMPPAKGPGVLIAGMCGGALTSVVTEVTRDLGRTVFLPFRCAQMKPGTTLWQSAANVLAQKDAAFAVLVVDQPELPVLMAAPEARWASVNVAPLRVGGTPEVFIRRVKQEIWRATCLVLGASDSQVTKCVMNPVLSVSDLDKLGTAANPEYLNRMLRKAAAAGINPMRPVTYRKAVEEGWAPEPANPSQKSIWDEVRAAHPRK